MKQKILFLCKKHINSYGRSYGLVNSANFVCNYLNSIGIQSDVKIANDGNEIDRIVSAYKPTMVILEALWITPAKISELLAIKRHQNILWIVRLHSKMPFLANEGMAMDWLGQYAKIEKLYQNFHIAANSEEVPVELYKIFGLTQWYLPNIYFPKQYKLPYITPEKRDFIKIGCFGAIRPLKNQLIQAMAAIEYGDEVGKKIHFYINADRIEMKGDAIFRNINDLFRYSDGHTLVLQKWLNHEDFISLVRTMDIGLQVSLSETFNIVIADFIWNEVPAIGSYDIEWMPEIFQADPNSSKDIKNKIHFAMNNLDTELCYLNKIALNKYNKKAKKIWLDIF